MGIGLGIFLMVIGAVLKFAITADVAGLDLDAMGIIFMLAGLAVVVLTLGLLATRGSRREGQGYRQGPPNDSDVL